MNRKVISQASSSAVDQPIFEHSARWFDNFSYHTLKIYGNYALLTEAHPH